MSAYLKYIHNHHVDLLPGMSDCHPEGLFIVIPAFLELNSILETLQSVYAASSPEWVVNLIVVVNYADTDSEQVKKTSEETVVACNQYKCQNETQWYRLVIIQAFDLPAKEKGAGLARKIGMDQVVAYCHENHLCDALIASLDADSLVESNYVSAIGAYFGNKSKVGCSVHFEHPIEGDIYNPVIYEGIALYELHLRYYINGLKAAGFPHSFQTVGSSMAFRVSAYVKAGGMTKKQAGEDFYFIHKLVQQGGFGNLTSTCVYPSPRPSHRVIFGTGATIQKWIDSHTHEYETYNLQSFIDLEILFDCVDDFFLQPSNYDSLLLKLPGTIRSFLTESHFYSDLDHVIQNCSQLNVFRKRFFEVFNAFRVIKYLNFVHDHFFQKIEVQEAALKLLKINNKMPGPDCLSVKELLSCYRDIDKKEQVLHLQYLK